MKRMNRVPLAMLLAFALLVPSSASAQTVLPQRQCVDNFLAACATLRYIDFSNNGSTGKGVLTLLVSNTSDAALAATTYIKQLVFDLTGSLPGFQGNATAQYGTWNGSAFIATPGDQEQWNAKTSQKTPGDLNSGFQVDLAVKDDAKADAGGNKDRVAGVGETVMITIDFDAPLAADVGLVCPDPKDCQSWSAEMKGWDADGDGKADHGFTTTPEPATLFLLGAGLLGIAGVQTVRRRRKGEFGE